jgi:hypothetical protein
VIALTPGRLRGRRSPRTLAIMWNRSGIRVRCHLYAAVLAMAALSACGGKDKKGANGPGDTASAVPKVDPTLCDTSGKNVVTFDLNKDGRPDVWRLYKSEEEGGTRVDILTCKQVDFDHDNRKDWVVGYNRKGGVLFEKADLDYDGRFDMSAVYDPKSGKVVEVERDSDFDGTYDLKELYDSGGAISSVRRDRNGDNNPDVWEQYKDGGLIAILYDDDNDSKVDRREEVPGSRPKIDMPTPGASDTASAPIPGSTPTTPQPAPPAGATTPVTPGASSKNPPPPVAPGAEPKSTAPVAPATTPTTAPKTEPAKADPKKPK